VPTIGAERDARDAVIGLAGRLVQDDGGLGVVALSVARQVDEPLAVGAEGHGVVVHLREGRARPPIQDHGAPVAHGHLVGHVAEIVAGDGVAADVGALRHRLAVAHQDGLPVPVGGAVVEVTAVGGEPDAGVVDAVVGRPQRAVRRHGAFGAPVRIDLVGHAPPVRADHRGALDGAEERIGVPLERQHLAPRRAGQPRHVAAIGGEELFADVIGRGAQDLDAIRGGGRREGGGHQRQKQQEHRRSPPTADLMVA